MNDLKRHENGTVVCIDESSEGLHTLFVIGRDLPFEDFVFFFKFNKKSYFDRDRYFRLDKNYQKKRFLNGKFY